MGPQIRSEADLAALRYSSEVLRKGVALGIYPEGTREGPIEKLREAHPGAALVALREDALILPVALTGTGHMSFPAMFRSSSEVHGSLIFKNSAPRSNRSE